LQKSATVAENGEKTATVAEFGDYSRLVATVDRLLDMEDKEQIWL